jgi:hypothetical protein
VSPVSVLQLDGAGTGSQSQELMAQADTENGDLGVGRGSSVTVLPFDYPIHKVAHHFDGVFISNGPGGTSA